MKSKKKCFMCGRSRKVALLTWSLPNYFGIIYTGNDKEKYNELLCESCYVKVEMLLNKTSNPEFDKEIAKMILSWR